MKTHIEEIKKKLVTAEKKKKKKTNNIDSAGKKFEYIPIEFKSKCKNSYLCELIIFCRIPVKPKRKKRKETSNDSIDHQATEHWGHGNKK